MRSNYLDVFELIENSNGQPKLVLLKTLELYSKIIAVGVLRSVSAPDFIILCFPYIKTSVLRYDASHCEFSLTNIFDLECDFNSGRHVQKPVLMSANSSTHTCFLLFDDNILLFYFDEENNIKNSLVGLSQTDLKFNRIVDAVFMDSYGDDTIGLLYEPLTTHTNFLYTRSDTFKFTAFSLDRETNSVIPLWSTKNLPYDSFKLLPMCSDLGGMCILSGYHVIYANQGVPPYVLGLDGGQMLTNLPLSS